MTIDLSWLPGRTAGPSSWRARRECAHGVFGGAATRSAPGGRFSGGPGPGYGVKATAAYGLLRGETEPRTESCLIPGQRRPVLRHPRHPALTSVNERTT